MFMIFNNLSALIPLDMTVRSDPINDPAIVAPEYIIPIQKESLIGYIN